MCVFLNFKVVKFMFFLLAIMTARNTLGKIKESQQSDFLKCFHICDFKNKH